MQAAVPVLDQKQVSLPSKPMSCGLWLRMCSWIYQAYYSSGQTKVKLERGPFSMGILTGIAYATMGSDYFKLNSAVNPMLSSFGATKNAQTAVDIWVMMSSLVRAIFVTGLSTKKKMNKLDISDILAHDYRGSDFVERWIEYHLEALKLLSFKEDQQIKVKESAQLILLIDTFFNLDADKRKCYSTHYIELLNKRFPKVKLRFTNDSGNDCVEGLAKFLMRNEAPSAKCRLVVDGKDVASYMFRNTAYTAENLPEHGTPLEKMSSFTHFYSQLRRELLASHEYASTLFDDKARQLEMTVEADIKHYKNAKKNIKLAVAAAQLEENGRLPDEANIVIIKTIRAESLATITAAKKILMGEIDIAQRKENYEKLRAAIYQYYLCQMCLNYGSHRHFVKRKLVELLEKSASHCENLKDGAFADEAIVKLLENNEAQRLMVYKAHHKGRAEKAFTYAGFFIGWLGILPTMLAYAVKSSITLAELLGSVLFAISAGGLTAVVPFVVLSMALTYFIYKKNKTAGIITGVVLGLCSLFVMSGFLFATAAVTPYLLGVMTVVALLVYGYQFLRFYNPGLQSTLAKAGEWVDHRDQASSDVVESSCPTWIKLLVATCTLAACPFLFNTVFYVLTTTLCLSVALSNPVGWAIVGLWGLGQFFFTFSLADKFQAAFKSHLGKRSELYKECLEQNTVWAYYVGFAIYVTFLLTIVAVSMMADKLGFDGLKIEGVYMGGALAISFFANFIKNVPDLSVNLLKPLISMLVSIKTYFTGKKEASVDLDSVLVGDAAAASDDREVSEAGPLMESFAEGGLIDDSTSGDSSGSEIDEPISSVAERGSKDQWMRVFS